MYRVCVEDREKGYRQYDYEEAWQAGQMAQILRWQADHQGVERMVRVEEVPVAVEVPGV